MVAGRARRAGQPLAHQAPEITKWLAHKDRRRWHLHITSTSSSWTNLTERWFNELTDRRQRRGVFTSASDLHDAVKLWATHWNDDRSPWSGKPSPTTSSPNSPTAEPPHRRRPTTRIAGVAPALSAGEGRSEPVDSDGGLRDRAAEQRDVEALLRDGVAE